MTDSNDPTSSAQPDDLAHAIAEQYALIRAAKVHLTAATNPEHRADLRSIIGEASARIQRLQRQQAQEART